MTNIKITAPNELIHHNCLIYSQASNTPDSWSFKDNAEENITIQVKGNLRSDNGSILMNAALNDQGLFIAPTFMITNALKEGKLETVLDSYTPMTSGLYVVYPYSQFVSTKVRAFVDFIALNSKTFLIPDI